MIPNDNTFKGAYLKVQRAEKHIFELFQASRPLNPHLYELTWIRAIGLPCGSSFATVSSDPESKVFELAFIPKEPIPETFALIIGDAVHNLRTSLDFAATAVVRAAGDTDTKFVTFPFHEEREKLVAASSGGIRSIQAALPNANVPAFFQDTVKPYKGGNTDLWMLTKIDKIDKHNFILPTVTIGNTFQDFMAHASQGMNILRIGSQMSHDASRPFALVRIDASNGFPQHDNVDVTADISFPHGELFGGLEVIPTLVNLSQIVLQTLKSFEKFVIDAGLASVAAN